MTNQIPEEDRKKVEAEANDIYRFAKLYQPTKQERLMVANQSIAFIQGAEFGYTLGLQSAEKKNEWIRVKDSKELLDLDVIATFLIHVLNKKTNDEYWEIITGYLDDTGAILNQHDDEYVGWDYSDVIYYKPITDLPPLSK